MNAGVMPPSSVRSVPFSVPDDDRLAQPIFLALFVLTSQNRLAHQADKRSHLDLQIDLLAEQEMAAVLQLLLDIARHVEFRPPRPQQLRDLNVGPSTAYERMEELAEPTNPTDSIRNLRLRRRPVS